MRNRLAEIARVWRLLNGPCKDMTALISQSLDGELPFWERFAYKLHLLYCRACRRYARQVRWLRGALRSAKDRLEGVGGAKPDEALPSEARTRIAERLRKSP